MGQMLIAKKKKKKVKINVFKAFCYHHTEKHRDMGNFKKLSAQRYLFY